MFTTTRCTPRQHLEGCWCHLKSGRSTRCEEVCRAVGTSAVFVGPHGRVKHACSTACKGVRLTFFLFVASRCPCFFFSSVSRWDTIQCDPTTGTMCDFVMSLRRAFRSNPSDMTWIDGGTSHCVAPQHSVQAGPDVP